MIYGEREERVSALSQVTTVRSFKKCDKDAMLSDLDRARWHVSQVKIHWGLIHAPYQFQLELLFQ